MQECSGAAEVMPAGNVPDLRAGTRAHLCRCSRPPMRCPIMRWPMLLWCRRGRGSCAGSLAPTTATSPPAPGSCSCMAAGPDLSRRCRTPASSPRCAVAAAVAAGPAWGSLPRDQHPSLLSGRLQNVFHNLSVAELYEKALQHEPSAHVVAGGALAVLSGAKTGRR